MANDEVTPEDFRKFRAKIKEEAKELRQKYLQEGSSKDKPKIKPKYERTKFLSPEETYKQREKAKRFNELLKNIKFAESKIGKSLSFAQKVKLMLRLNGGKQPKGQKVVYVRSPPPRTIPPRVKPIGWEILGVPEQLESELMDFNKGSLASEGDRAAHTLGREALFHGAFTMPLPTKRVNQEADFHCRDVDINPALALESDVFNFASVLNPRRKRRR